MANAASAGVSTMVNISTRESEWDAVVATADRYPQVWASIGIHPHEADAHPDIDCARLKEAAAHPKVVGIGESGLDYYYKRSSPVSQQASFRTHIAATRELGLPLIVHTRDAEDDTAAIMREEMAAAPYKAVIHCFTASRHFAEQAIEIGCFISLSGIVTFKSAADIQETAKIVPLDRLLVETDAPFLAPVPHRGKVCEPAFTADTVRFLAQLRGCEADELASATTANFFRLFDKAKPLQ